MPGQPLAVTAESLYLINLLLLPGLAFLALWWLYLKHRLTAPPLARQHLRETLFASIWAGLLLIALSALILGVGGYQTAYGWVVIGLYVLLCHSTLVLLGIFGLARAMAGRPFHYPLIGGAEADG